MLPFKFRQAQSRNSRVLVKGKTVDSNSTIQSPMLQPDSLRQRLLSQSPSLAMCPHCSLRPVTAIWKQQAKRTMDRTTASQQTQQGFWMLWGLLHAFRGQFIKDCKTSDYVKFSVSLRCCSILRWVIKAWLVQVLYPNFQTSCHQVAFVSFAIPVPLFSAHPGKQHQEETAVNPATHCRTHTIFTQRMTKMLVRPFDKCGVKNWKPKPGVYDLILQAPHSASWFCSTALILISQPHKIRWRFEQKLSTLSEANK